MRALLLALALAASGASAQAPTSPLAPESARTYRSASGQFTLDLPKGWDRSDPTGEMLQGEVILWHTDSTYVSPLLLPAEHCDDLSPEACADAVLHDVVLTMTEDGGPGVSGQPEVTARAHFKVGDKRLTWQTIRYTQEPDGPQSASLHFALVSQGSTHVFVIAASPPSADPNRWRRLVNTIDLLPSD